MKNQTEQSKYAVSLYLPYYYENQERKNLAIVAAFDTINIVAVSTRGDGVSLYELKIAKAIDLKASMLDVLFYSEFSSEASIDKIAEKYAKETKGELFNNKNKALAAKLPNSSAKQLACTLFEILKNDSSISYIKDEFGLSTKFIMEGISKILSQK